MSRVLAGGVVFDVQDYLEDHLPAQPCLARARDAHGHALCLCAAPNRQLVIREVRQVLYLAVWPNDGHHHDPSCEFFRDPATADAIPPPSPTVDTAGQPPKARIPLEPAARLNAKGLWDIHLDLPQQAKANNAGQSPPPPPRHLPPDNPDVAHRPGRDSFSLPQFLAWLWDSTSMARWGAGWRRDWWRVARAIRMEAQAVTIRGENLNDLLYIPPPYRKDKEPEIHAEWQAFAQPLLHAAAQGQCKRAFMLVEIKSVERTDFGYRLQARNLARPIFMDHQLHAQISRQAPLGLALLPRRKELKCSLVALLLVEATEKGNLRAVSAAVMLTNRFFIPVVTLYELELSNKLCEADRTFTRGAGKHVGADFVLRDTSPPTAMVIYSLLTHEYVRRRDRVVEDCRKVGCNIWTWEPAAALPIPAIPAPKREVRP